MLADGNMKAEETLFVDDSTKNIEAAANEGIETLLVTNGEDWRTSLEEKLVGHK
jgi:putative hydrolase of the HAD superfamily